MKELTFRYLRGGLGAILYFSCVREGTRVSHAKFQVSMSIRSVTVVFYKNEGGPLLSLTQKKPNKQDSDALNACQNKFNKIRIYFMQKTYKKRERVILISSNIFHKRFPDSSRFGRKGLRKGKLTRNI